MSGLGFPLNCLTLPYGRLSPLSLVVALAALLYALILAAFANNKVQGLTLMKGLGVFFMASIAAWFVPEPWRWLLGVMPTHWPAKTFWQLVAGETYWPAFVMGAVVSLCYIWAMVRRFERTLG